LLRRDGRRRDDREMFGAHRRTAKLIVNVDIRDS
jgi:hypothetical protein